LIKKESKLITFTDFDTQWYISFTEKCNWKCPYCDFPSKAGKTVDSKTLESFIKYCRFINKVKLGYKKIEYEFEGGESGLVPEDLLDQWFNSGVATTYQIDTNGLFLNKYLEKYIDKLHYILYHVYPNFTSVDEINFKTYKEFDKYVRIDYTVVIHNKNYKELPKILEKYASLNWLPHFSQNRLDSPFGSMNKKQYQWLYENTKNYPNLLPYIKERLRRISEQFGNPELVDRRKKCASIYRKPLIDLPNNLIRRCCITGSGDYIELTLENLMKLKLNQTIFSEIEKRCKDCYAGFVWDTVLY